METLCVSKYGKGRNISITRLRYSANHNALDSWPIRAHRAFQNEELCKNRRVSERRGREEYGMWKIMCFFNLKPRKHIALHQIHQIMLFLAPSYDSFNSKLNEVRWPKMFKNTLQNHPEVMFCSSF